MKGCNVLRNALTVVCVVVAIAATANIAGAEFFRYVGPDGAVRYTDDPAEIPSGQVDSARRYEGVPSPPAPAASPAQSAAPEAEKSIDGAGAGAAPKASNAGSADPQQAAALAQLSETKSALDREYAQLARERSELLAGRRTWATDIQAKAYKQKMEALNDRIRAYDARKKKFERQVADFNNVASNPQ